MKNPVSVPAFREDRTEAAAHAPQVRKMLPLRAACKPAAVSMSLRHAQDPQASPALKDAGGYRPSGT